MKENLINKTNDDKDNENKVFVLTVTSKSITSSDNLFNIDNLSDGDFYKPTSTYFKDEHGKKINRKRIKNENKISNKTLPRLAMQIYEKKILSLSEKDRLNFPICKYGSNKEVIKGIYTNVEELKVARNRKNTLEFIEYTCDNNKKLVIYYWNIFSTLYFVQECLKRWGKQGDSFILKYRRKTDKELKMDSDKRRKDANVVISEYVKNYSKKLSVSNNIIFRGAPGTGKTYLAKEIAAYIVSGASTQIYNDLTSEQKKTNRVCSISSKL